MPLSSREGSREEALSRPAAGKVSSGGPRGGEPPPSASTSGDKGTGEASEEGQILLVDDEPDLCLLYSEELAGEGYRVRTAGTCAEALNLLRHFNFDLLILDIQLHRESGLQILQWVAREKPQLPVILCTAFSCYLDDFAAWRADACVIKSSDFAPLKEEVRRQIDRRRAAM